MYQISKKKKVGIFTITIYNYESGGPITKKYRKDLRD